MEDLVSPFDETVRDPLAPAPRLRSLEGARVTLFSISKPKSAEFLSELGETLAREYGATVRYAHKPTFAAPAPPAILESVLAESDAVIEALAD